MHGENPLALQLAADGLALAQVLELADRILDHFGVTSVRLLSNNPDEIRALEEEGVTVAEGIPCEAEPLDSMAGYLRTKKKKLGHLLESL